MSAASLGTTKIMREVLGMIERGEVNIFGDGLSRKLSEALARIDLDGLAEASPEKGSDLEVLTDKGRRWIETYDRTHAKKATVKRKDAIEGWADGVEHDEIGAVMLKLDGERRGAPRTKGLSNNELAAFMVANDKGWMSAEGEVLFVTDAGEAWLVGSLQDNIINAIIEKRQVRELEERRRANPEWGTW